MLTSIYLLAGYRILPMINSLTGYFIRLKNFEFASEIGGPRKLMAKLLDGVFQSSGAGKAGSVCSRSRGRSPLDLKIRRLKNGFFGGGQQGTTVETGEC